ncbi:uncharacterized protein LOC125026792 [Penaeus chinensis]|uniref:uncharacterized protein LOC125026792 n=1 Tax=Penaeus chinensis TaxID=139456 RepID=UPI001FB6ED72|nr:uncharacterized protein LOC125026792 [Penaeus chinensis]
MVILVVCLHILVTCGFLVSASRCNNGSKMNSLQHYISQDLRIKVLTTEEEVLQRWNGYFEWLMNVENPKEIREENGVMGEVMDAGVTQDEVKKALKKMKRGKAQGPDNIPIEAGLSLEEAEGRMPDEWRKSTLIIIYKNKGDAQDCGNFRGIKPMSHTMKLWENLEKAYARVPREELKHYMQESSIPEVYVRMAQDMFNECMTAVRSAVGTTEGFKVEVGLHQGSALSPVLFAVIMDKFTGGLRKGALWSMMLADDFVLRSESREVEDLERWRHALERRGMKVSRRKTEYFCVNEKEGDSRVNMQGKEISRVNEFQYFGSTVDCERSGNAEAKKGECRQSGMGGEK